MSLQFLSSLLCLAFVASCSQSSAPIQPRQRSRPIMVAPNSALAGATMNPGTRNQAGQQARFQAQAAEYRRSANLATGAEREQLLQMAEQMDVRAASVAPAQ